MKTAKILLLWLAFLMSSSSFFCLAEEPVTPAAPVEVEEAEDEDPPQEVKGVQSLPPAPGTTTHAKSLHSAWLSQPTRPLHSFAPGPTTATHSSSLHSV